MRWPKLALPVICRFRCGFGKQLIFDKKFDQDLAPLGRVADVCLIEIGANLALGERHVAFGDVRAVNFGHNLAGFIGVCRLQRKDRDCEGRRQERRYCNCGGVCTGSGAFRMRVI